MRPAISRQLAHLCVVCLLLFIPPAITQPTQTFTSGDQQVRLLELYTSEGCSSCPPADAWLATLLDHPGLWQDLVPVAFHVDYWNYLGWRDPLSDASFSERQRDYQRSGRVRAVYTPGFVLQGKEWRGWFSREPVPRAYARSAGTLQAEVDGNMLSARYTPPEAIDGPLSLNVALLGFDISRTIPRGENRGKVLTHQFAVTEHRTALSANSRWQLALPESDITQKMGIAIWVSHPHSPHPLQATGGWLNSSEARD